MSRLFDHDGAPGSGYAQPSPLIDKEDIEVTDTFKRKVTPNWPRISEPEMVRHYTCYQKEISVSTQVSILLVLAQ